MALSFNSGSLNGSGSLVTQQLTSGTPYTFTIKNNGVATNNSYLTLEGNASANTNLSTTVTVTGSLTEFAGNMALASGSEKIVESSTKWSINLPYFSLTSGTGTFKFTPSTTISANTTYLKSTGNYTVDIAP
tara:strand:- start:691 stop:1086 length:396 start_codon:yes stop_codon:yes gene_type:complete